MRIGGCCCLVHIYMYMCVRTCGPRPFSTRGLSVHPHCTAAAPQAVSKLVLIDAQGFIDGIGPMSSLPRPLAVAGVSVLRTEQLREAANQMAYFNKQKFATADARRVGRLHTFCPGGWNRCWGLRGVSVRI